jgi:transmembrane sensor
MNEPFHEQLMVRYLQGTCTPEEKTLFEAWLLASEENRKQFYDTRMLWYASRIEFFGSKAQLDKALATLNSNRQQRHKRSGKKIVLQWAKYAAIFIAALAVAWLFSVLSHNSRKTNTMITAVVAHTDSSKLVVLSDGTHVWLNSNSRIRYPQQFANDKRTVTLEGEAYFDVKHDAAHPFIIHTASIDIKVLGTAFNVQAYSPENGVEAILVRGKIAIGDSLGHQMAVMAPGQMARFAGNKLTVQPVDPEQYTNWRYGNIALNAADLKTIGRKLAELYQVHITIQPGIADTARYNFTFSKRKPVKEVMDMLCFIAPVHYQMQGKDILITQK